MVKLASFCKPEAYGQTVLPDRSIVIGQKLKENAKIQNSNSTFWVIFKQCVVVDMPTLLLESVSRKIFSK